MNTIELQIKDELEKQFLSWKDMITNQSVLTNTSSLNLR